jgi:hypothetical protein
MNVMVLQVFVSLMLVAGSVVLFVHSVRQRDHEHADRLSLAPLEDDLPEVPPPQSASKENACKDK